MPLTVWTNNRPVVEKVYQWGPINFSWVGINGQFGPNLVIPHNASFATTDWISLRGFFFVDGVDQAGIMPIEANQTLQFTDTVSGADIFVNIDVVKLGDTTLEYSVGMQPLSLNGAPPTTNFSFNLRGHLVHEVTS